MSKQIPSKETPGKKSPSKESLTRDHRERTDWGSHSQTDKPWKGPPEKEQKPSDKTPDLEKWQRSDTH